MKARVAFVALALMVGGTAAALLAPVGAAAALAFAAFALMRGKRRAYFLLAATALPLNVLIVSLSVAGPGWGTFSAAGAFAGLVAGTRLLAALGVSLAVLSWAPPARILDGLALPRRATALLAAVLIAAHDVARDFERLRDSRRARGEWPKGRLARARAAAALLPLLLVSAHDRGLARRDALRLAGVAVGASFAPVVAVAALAAAGRLAFLAFPNVALTYVVVFLGGLLFGARVGAAGGALGMLVTDFMLTGLYPLGFVNIPAMALLGLVGGACRRVDFLGAGARGDRAAGAMLAGAVGIAGTFLFSVAVDSATWLLVLRDEPQAWRGLVLAGLAFNVLPALVNGALFAGSTAPTLAAWRAREAARAPQARGAPTARPDPARDAPQTQARNA